MIPQSLLTEESGDPQRAEEPRKPRHERHHEEPDFPLPTESEMWRRTLKGAMKEAIKEWLDDQFATLGKWTISALLAVFLAAAVWVVLTSKGWKPPP